MKNFKKNLQIGADFVRGYVELRARAFKCHPMRLIRRDCIVIESISTHELRAFASVLGHQLIP
jgi:hypothetical protein